MTPGMKQGELNPAARPRQTDGTWIPDRHPPGEVRLQVKAGETVRWDPHSSHLWLDSGSSDYLWLGAGATTDAVLASSHRSGQRLRVRGLRVSDPGRGRSIVGPLNLPPLAQRKSTQTAQQRPRGRSVLGSWNAVVHRKMSCSVSVSLWLDSLKKRLGQVSIHHISPGVERFVVSQGTADTFQGLLGRGRDRHRLPQARWLTAIYIIAQRSNRGALLQAARRRDGNPEHQWPLSK